MLVTALAHVEDKRRAQARKYELQHILLFTIMAILTGADSYRKVESFIKIHLKRLKKIFKLRWKRAPGYATLRYALHKVSTKELEQVFRVEARDIAKRADKGEELWTVNLDGKTIQRSNDGKDAPLQLLSAFLTNHRIVLGHIDIESSDKTNEIPKFQKLIKDLGLKGVIFTMDALNTQKKLWRWCEGQEILQ